MEPKRNIFGGIVGMGSQIADITAAGYYKTQTILAENIVAAYGASNEAYGKAMDILAGGIVKTYDVGSEAGRIAERELAETIAGIQVGSNIAFGYVTEGISGVTGAVTGAAGAVTGAVGSVGESFKSAKMWLWAPIALLIFVVVLISIGYSGLGAPAARIAEREHARTR